MRSHGSKKGASAFNDNQSEFEASQNVECTNESYQTGNIKTHNLDSKRYETLIPHQQAELNNCNGINMETYQFLLRNMDSKPVNSFTYEKPSTQYADFSNQSALAPCTKKTNTGTNSYSASEITP